MSRVFERGESDRDEVALTFDAGADRGYAEEILGTLEEYGVKASFAITGHWADENPDLVARMVEEGHQVFNHTWTHRSFTGYSTAGWDEGVLDSDERAKELGLGDVRINASGCLDRCELGPSVVVYPEGVWYTVRTPEDVDEVLKAHLIEGGRVRRLMMDAPASASSTAD